MANAARGEVGIVIEGEARVMRLTLGALAALEERLGSTSLVALAERFEQGEMKAGELIALLAAGLEGGGNPVPEAELAGMVFEGGPVGAMRAGAELLARTFSQ